VRVFCCDKPKSFTIMMKGVISIESLSTAVVIASATAESNSPIEAVDLNVVIQLVFHQSPQSLELRN
jgi:hypothetical protein